LSADPVHRLLLDRDPVEGDELASQPTLSRFENTMDVRQLVLFADGRLFYSSMMSRISSCLPMYYVLAMRTRVTGR